MALGAKSIIKLKMRLTKKLEGGLADAKKLLIPIVIYHNHHHHYK